MNYNNPNNSGFIAFKQGRSRDENPCSYRTEANARYEWFQGWDRAQKLSLRSKSDEKLSQLSKSMRSCPNCPNQGWYVQPNQYTGEPEQEQCEFCECEPDSVFNTIRSIQQELDDLKASIKGMVKHAHECEDHFLGGYRDKKELDAFVHGMRTVASCVEGYANQLEGDTE